MFKLKKGRQISPSSVHFLQLQLVTEDSKKMFKIARGTFRVVVFLLTETIVSNSLRYRYCCHQQLFMLL